jgi:uncharacterized delta-60 repeat protein
MFEILKTTRTGRQILRSATKTLGSASVVAALIGFAGGRGVAQTAGSLDTTFGTGGIVTTNPTLIGGNPNAPGGAITGTLTAIEQSNGDIAVVTGINTSAFPNLEVFGLVRYTSGGTLIGATSASFFNEGISSPIAVAAQSNGDIVVAGTASASIDGATSFAVARFTADGQLDTTFGTGGLVLTTPAGIFPTASALLVQANGQILVAGLTTGVNKNTPGGTVLVRFNSNGSLDTKFGAGGIVEAPTAAGSPVALAQLSNGSYLAVSGGNSVEFSATGVLQSTVTPAQLVAATHSGSGCCSPVLFQPNGDFVLATLGPGVGRRGSDVQVFRFIETGVQDSSFSSTPFMFGGNAQNDTQAIALQSNGQIVVGGLTNAHGTPATGGLARLNSNGNLDTTFATGGSLMSSQIVTGLLIQEDGKIVAIGASGENLVLERYLAN